MSKKLSGVSKVHNVRVTRTTERIVLKVRGLVCEVEHSSAFMFYLPLQSRQYIQAPSF